MKQALAISILLVTASFAVGQTNEQLIEDRRLRAVRAQLDSAVYLTDNGEYQAADEKYVYVLKNMKSIPSDLAYNFGRNSYQLGKYSQSIDWLNKYIQLKGTSGTYSDEAATWLEKANAARLKERQEESANASVILSRNYDIDCGPTGKVTCPVCKGSTVVIKRTYFGESYKTCTACNHNGYLNCEDFNKLLRGELKLNP